MLKMNRTLYASALAVIFAAMRISAHHAFASEYDEKKLVTVSGTVTALEWTNPHAWLRVEGKEASGKLALWSFEMGSPGGLISRGWTREAVKVGDHATVDGFRAKNKVNVANARTVALPDGKRLFGGFQETPGNPFK